MEMTMENLMKKVLMLEEKNEKLKEKNNKLKEKNDKLKEKNDKLKEKVDSLKPAKAPAVKDITLGDTTIESSGIGPLDSELKKAIKQAHFGKQELRFIVDRYYDIQKKRIELGNQLFAISKNQAENESDEKCHDLLEWEFSIYKTLEKGYQQAMEIASTENRSGRWLRSVLGIGPALAATMEAYFDIDKANHRSCFIQYAGLNDNNRKWLGKDKAAKIVEEIINDISDDIYEKFYSETISSKYSSIEEFKEIANTRNDLIKIVTKFGNDEDKKNLKEIVGTLKETTVTYLEKICVKTDRDISKLQKKTGLVDDKGNYINLYTIADIKTELSILPHNLKLKTAMWKCGEQFLKVCNNPNSLYGKLYRERKVYELKNNEEGKYAEQAAEILRTKNIQNKEALEINKAGKLTPGHIEARCKRYAVSMFVSHYWEACHFYKYGEVCEDPYPIGFLGHVDYIRPEVEYDSIK